MIREIKACNYKRAKRYLEENGFQLKKTTRENFSPYSIYPNPLPKNYPVYEYNHKPRYDLAKLYVTKENNGLIELSLWNILELEIHRKRLIDVMRKLQPALEDFI